MFTKIMTWLRVNGASVLGALQAVIKAFKELFTAVINLISIIVPVAWAQGLVDRVRSFCEMIDGWVEKVKVWLLDVVL
jgi:hypothetical protein